jgi:hypothetical protein
VGLLCRQRAELGSVPGELPGKHLLHPVWPCEALWFLVCCQGDSNRKPLAHRWPGDQSHAFQSQPTSALCHRVRCTRGVGSVAVAKLQQNQIAHQAYVTQIYLSAAMTRSTKITAKQLPFQADQPVLVVLTSSQLDSPWQVRCMAARWP